MVGAAGNLGCSIVVALASVVGDRESWKTKLILYLVLLTGCSGI